MKMLRPKLAQLPSPGLRDPEAQRRKKLYSTARWRRMRADHIRREPLCRTCSRLGLVVQAEVVDHIDGHRDAQWEQRFFDASRLQSLCFTCHQIKTGQETAGGVGRTSMSRSSPTPPPPSRHRAGPR